MILTTTIIGLCVAILSAFVLVPQFGTRNKYSQRKLASPNYVDGKFINPIPTDLKMNGKEFRSMLKEYFNDKIQRKPIHPIRNIAIDLEHKDTNAISIKWLGHSSVLISIKGQTILCDPVFSERASVFQFAGPKQFSYETQYSPIDLPKLDAVIISHDHYDHLDYNTIKAIHRSVPKFFVPIGVEEHLLNWGVDADKIVVFDWWDEAFLDNDVKIVATPARHFSGRKMIDKDETLWASWVMKSNVGSVFFSGDSGYFPGFKDIGEKYGPFKYTLMECGQYNERWSAIHMMPEESVQAHIDLKGEKMIPIHWSKFSLSFHSWTEPVERAIAKAKSEGIEVITPQIGQTITPQSNTTHWWKDALHAEVQ